jgi:hypothetical protein
VEIKILSREQIEFQERDVQRAFEKDLSSLEDGLEFVASEVTIGTGRIDTLAFDTNTNQPVFIEYKRRGEFSESALVQLMEYLSWFARDENHTAVLTGWISQHRKIPDSEIEPSIRVLCVVTDIGDRVRNAVYVIANNVKVFSYVVSRDTNGAVVLVPKLEVDNSDVEAQVPEVASEAEVLRKNGHLVPVFEKVRAALRKDGTDEYPRPKGFNYKARRVYARAKFRQEYLFLELRVGRDVSGDPAFKGRQGSWGYFHLYPHTEVPAKVFEWIEKARAYKASAGDEEEVEVEEEPDAKQ